MPDRFQFNHSVRSCTELIEEMALHLAQVLLEARESPYEALDSSAMPIRDAKRRGAGWLAGHADIGWSNSLGWYEGFRLLAAVDPRGVVTGFCFSAASSADQQAAETFFAVRACPDPRLISVGSAARGPYVTDKGFAGSENHRQWLDCYGARLICPPKRNARWVWPKRLRRWVASIRQIVESVYDKLFNTFGLLLGALLWYSPPAQTAPDTQSAIPPDTDGEVPVEGKCEPEGNPEWGEDWLAMYQWKTIRDGSDNVKEIYGKVYLNLCRMENMGLTQEEKLAALSHEMAHSRGWRHYEGTPEENAAYYPHTR